MPRNKLAPYVFAFFLTIMAGSIAAYAASFTATPTDTVTISDRAALRQSTRDTVPLSDSTANNARSTADTVPLADSTANNARSTADTVAVADEPSSGGHAKDALAPVDFVRPDNVAVDTVVLSDSPVIDTFLFHPVFASDTVAVADAVIPDGAALDTVTVVDLVFPDVVALDVVSLSDNGTIAIFDFFGIPVTDIVDIADTTSIIGSIIDIVQISEAASLPLTSVTDVVDIVITPSLAIVKPLLDQLGVEDAFSDIAVSFFRTFAEVLAMPDCVFTDESGVCNRVALNTIIFGDLLGLFLDAFSTPAEQLAAVDQFARSYTGGRSDSESLQTRDSGAMTAASPPPAPPASIAAMPPVTMADTNTMEEIGASDPAEAVEVDGTWDLTGLDNGNLESLLVAMGMPIYNVSSLAGSDGIEEMTMVLPTFELSIDDVPNGGVFVTPTVSDMPAGLQVMAPIDVKESMGESLGPLGNMTVSFTPAAAGNNVTMMIALLDDNPEQDLTSEWPDGVSAFYIDLSFAGDFAGPDLSDEAFYDDGPLLTFTLDTDWAMENDLRLPKVNLFLLDEATGEWEELRITGLPQSPVNGIYTYTAELPHMSTYAVTADRLLQGEDSDEYDVSLSESLFVTGSAVQGPAGGGRTIIRDLVESVEIGIGTPETQHQRVITFQNFTVGVSVTDIRSSDQFGTAVVLLKFEIVNAGGSPEELAIKYWYVDSGGTTAYEDTLTMTVGSSEYVVREVQVPFKSAGVYSIMVEAVAQDQTLAATDITIEVPWLAANLYLLAIIITAVVAVSIGFVAYAMRSRL